MSNDTGRATLAFEPGDQVRRIEHDADGKQIDSPIQVVDPASGSAARITVKGDNNVYAEWHFEHAPGTAQGGSRVRIPRLGSLPVGQGAAARRTDR